MYINWHEKVIVRLHLSDTYLPIGLMDQDRKMSNNAQIKN